MILVVGATGLLGGAITRELLRRGELVRALVRPGSDHAGLRAAGAETVYGDLKDPDSLSRACLGVDVVVTTANSAGRGGEDSVDTVELRGNRALIDAARAAGARQLVFVSALGASADSPVPFMRGKGMTELYLRESGMGYTILSPNIFMDVWVPMLVGMPVQQGRPVTLVADGRRRHALIAVRDVAAFAAAAVGNPLAMDRQLPLGGPDAVSWREVVQATERVLGREVPLRFVAPGEPLPGLPEVVAQLAASFESYDSPLEMRATAREFGVELTPLESFLRQMLAVLPPPAA